MFLVRLGEPGEVQVAAVHSLLMKVYYAQDVNECGLMVGSLAHKDVRAQKEITAAARITSGRP